MQKQDPFVRRNSASKRSRGKWTRRFLGLAAFIVLIPLVYQIPFVNDRLAWRVSNLRTQIIYYFNPPDEAVFVPQEQEISVVAPPSPTAQPAEASSTPALEPILQPTLQPTSLPLPVSVRLDGFDYVDQHNRWNYCGPANLAMALDFWGWDGNRDEIAAYVKPGINGEDGREDKNVMPYEMEDFVESQAGMQAVVRVGGDPELLKRLISAGFPVIVEKGYYERDYTGKLGWLGHYQFVTGYDEASGFFLVQDTYLTTGENGTGANMQWAFDDFVKNWRSFNFLFMVVYPEERRAELIDTLGPWADEAWADSHALEIAEAERLSLTGIDQFFAWFNQGSSHVRLFEYVDAASAYDFAFQLYAALDNDDSSRPYRIMWYQTGPYFAYFYSGRYQDTISLANTTLFETIAEPTLEESLYWRGRAYEAIGELDNAIADYEETVRLNPNFSPGWAQLERLGLSG